MIELPRVVPLKPGRPEWGDAKLPMQDLTRRIATETDTAWTPERVAETMSFFDSMATDWPDRDTPERHDALRDALARGGPFPTGACLEVGAGTGNATGDLREAFSNVISTDLSWEMLALAPPTSPRVQADGFNLPVPDGSIAIVVLVNMFLFPSEVDRVLASEGVLVWVSSNGVETPISMPPVEVLHALPGEWSGVTAEAGWGTWLAARR